MNYCNILKTAGLASLLFAGPAFAEPVTIPVQGLLADADGKAIESVQDATFQIVNAGGDVLWEEVQSIAADNGLFSVWLGSRTELDSAVFTTPGIQLKMTLGNDSLGPWNLGFAPYAVAAIYAKTALSALSLDGQEASDFAAADHAHTLEVGAGLNVDDDGEVSVDQEAIEAWAEGVSFNTAEEVTAALGDTYLASDQCAAGQVLKRDANGWACATDDTGSTNSAGAGISISGVGAISVAAGGVTTAMLAAASVDGSKLADGAVTRVKLSNSGCTDGQILKRSGAGWVCGADANTADTNTTYGAGSGLTLSGTTFSIGSGAINAGHLGTNSVNYSEIASSAVRADEIAANAVGASEIASSAVGASEIATDAVRADEIAANAVGASEIASGAVGASEIATDAVRASEIQAGAVGNSELASNAVTGAKIAAGAISNSDIASNAAIALSKIASNTIFVEHTGNNTTSGTNLRNAVINANATCSAPKSIVVSAGVFDLGANTITLDECMSITGPGPYLATIVSTNSVSRVLSGASYAVVSGVTLHGKGASGNTSTSVVYNTSVGGSWAYRSQFRLSNCFVKTTNGTSDNNKHVIYNGGEMDIENTSIYSNIGGSSGVHGVRTNGATARTYIRDSTIYMERSSGTGNKFGVTAYLGANVDVYSSTIYASTQSSSEGYGVYSTGTGSIVYVYASKTYGQRYSAYETSGGDVTFYGGRLGNNENGGVSCTGMRAYSGNSGLDGNCD
jgi:hypothetical protein